MNSEEEDEKIFLEPLSDASPSPYSVMSLFSKMPLEESGQQERLSSVADALPSILNLYTAIVPNKAIKCSVPEEYASFESDLFYEASHL